MKGLSKEFLEELDAEADVDSYEKYGVTIGMGKDQKFEDTVYIEETNYEIDKDKIDRYPFKFSSDEHIDTFTKSSAHPGAKHIFLKEGHYKNKKRTDRMIKRSAAFYIELLFMRELKEENVFTVAEHGELDIILKGCYGETDLFNLRIIECMIIGIDEEKNFHYLDYDLREGFCQADEVR